MEWLWLPYKRFTKGLWRGEHVSLLMWCIMVIIEPIQGLLTVSASAEPPITALLSCGFLFSSKTLKPQTNSSVFGSLQNLKEDKTKPVRDEYEYVSDEGELKIDEFPIRRKKNTAKRDLSCEYSVKCLFKPSFRAGYQTSTLFSIDLNVYVALSFQNQH